MSAPRPLRCAACRHSFMRTLRETQGESIGIPEVAAFRTLLLWCGRRDALAEMVCEDFEYEPGTDALKALVP